MDYEREAREFMEKGCHVLAIGDGSNEMRDWEFDIIYDIIQTLKPGYVLRAVPVRRRR